MRDLLALYLIIGGGFWLLSLRLGIIGAVYQSRVTAHGRLITNRALVIATVLMILLWPALVFCIFRGMRSAAR